jgi:hypothetical protein
VPLGDEPRDVLKRHDAVERRHLDSDDLGHREEVVEQARRIAHPPGRFVEIEEDEWEPHLGEAPVVLDDELIAPLVPTRP